MKQSLIIITALLLSLVGCSSNGPARQHHSIATISIETPDLEQSYPIGVNIPYAAVAFYNTGDKVLEDYTSNVQWRIESNSESSISISEATLGLVQTNHIGTATIVARDPSSGATSSQQITVYNSSLSKLSLNADLFAIPLGKQLQLNATGDYQEAQNSRSIPLNYSVNWTIAAGASHVKLVNAVTEPGRIEALSAGEATIVASFDGKMESIVITVTNATLESIELANPLGMINNNLAIGSINKFRTLGRYSDGSWYDLTNQTTWIGKDGDGRDSGSLTTTNGLITTVSPGDVKLIASAAGKNFTQPLHVLAKVLVSIFVKPAIGDDVKAMVTHTAMAFKAYALYADGTVADVTRSAAWSAESRSIRMGNTVNNIAGYANALTSSSGNEVTIDAKLAGQTGKYQVIVLDKAIDSLTVARNNLEFIPGLQQQYFAIGVLDNYILELTSSARWFVNPLAIGQFNAGVLSANQPLSGTIYATARGATSNNLRVNVSNKAAESLVINPANFTSNTVAQVATIEFAAQLNFNDDSIPFDLTNSPAIIWTSDNAAVVRPTSIKGQFMTGDISGIAHISANFTNPVTHRAVVGSFTVHVGNAKIDDLVVTPNTDINIATGAKQLFSVTLIDSDNNTYKISHPLGIVNMLLDTNSSQYATIDLTTGTLTAGNSSATDQELTVSYIPFNDSVKAIVKFNIVAAATIALRDIMINQTESTILSGNIRNYTAIATYSNSSTKALIAPRDVYWSIIGESTVATIDSYGRLVAESPGNVTVKAQLINNGQLESDVAAIVTQELTVLSTDAPNADTLESLEITSTDNSTESIAIQQQRYYKMIAHYKNHTDYNVDPEQIAWKSTNPQVATIDGLDGSATFGVATGISQGITTITASFSDKASSVILGVNSESIILGKITIVGPSTAIAGSPISYKAYGDYYDSNGALFMSQQPITHQVSWVSESDSASFSSTAKGLLTGNKSGSALITATLDGVTESRVINVVATSQIESLAVNSSGDNILTLGGSKQYTAKVMLADGPAIDVTNDANWDTESLAIATVDNLEHKGKLTARAVGKTNVIANYAGKSVKQLINIQANRMESIVAIYLINSTNDVYETPQSLIMVPLSREQFQLVARLNHGEIVPLETNRASWSSSNPEQVSFIRGTAIALKRGGVSNLSASYSYKGKLWTTPAISINVLNGNVAKLTIDQHRESVPYKSTLEFTVESSFDTESPEFLTTGVRWSSDNPEVSFDNPYTGTAHISGNVANNTTVTIKVQSIADASVESTTTIIVKHLALLTLQIYSSTTLTAVGQQRQLRVDAIYASDNVIVPYIVVPLNPGQVLWKSSEESIVSVNDFGLVTALTKGQSMVWASYQDIQIGVTITVDPVPPPKEVDDIAINPNPIWIFGLGTSVEADAKFYTPNGQIDNSSDGDTLWSANDLAEITPDGNSHEPVMITAKEPDGEDYVNVTYNKITTRARLYTADYPLIRIQIVTPELQVMSTNQTITNNLRVIAYFRKNTGEYLHQVIARNDPQLEWFADDKDNPVLKVTADSIMSNTKTGLTGISVSYFGKISHKDFNVKADRTLESISFWPMFESVAINTEICYSVFAFYSDGTLNNVSIQANIDLAPLATNLGVRCTTPDGLDGALYQINSTTTNGSSRTVHVSYKSKTANSSGKLTIISAATDNTSPFKIVPVVYQSPYNWLDPSKLTSVSMKEYTHAIFRAIDIKTGRDISNKVHWSATSDRQLLSIDSNGVAYLTYHGTGGFVVATYGLESASFKILFNLTGGVSPMYLQLNTGEHGDNGPAGNIRAGRRAKVVGNMYFFTSGLYQVDYDILQDLNMYNSRPKFGVIDPISGFLYAIAPPAVALSATTMGVTTDNTFYIYPAQDEGTPWVFTPDSVKLNTSGYLTINRRMEDPGEQISYDVTWLGSACDGGKDCGIYVIPAGSNLSKYYVYGSESGVAHIMASLPDGNSHGHVITITNK